MIIFIMGVGTGTWHISILFMSLSPRLPALSLLLFHSQESKGLEYIHTLCSLFQTTFTMVQFVGMEKTLSSGKPHKFFSSNSNINRTLVIRIPGFYNVHNCSLAHKNWNTFAIHDIYIHFGRLIYNISEMFSMSFFSPFPRIPSSNKVSFYFTLYL